MMSIQLQEKFIALVIVRKRRNGGCEKCLKVNLQKQNI